MELEEFFLLISLLIANKVRGDLTNNSLEQNVDLG
jgi:hypothetical protein